MSNLFENLNDKQREAVMATEGKVRVVAQPDRDVEREDCGR